MILIVILPYPSTPKSLTAVAMSEILIFKDHISNVSNVGVLLDRYVIADNWNKRSNSFWEMQAPPSVSIKPGQIGIFSGSFLPLKVSTVFNQ